MVAAKTDGQIHTHTQGDSKGDPILTDTFVQDDFEKISYIQEINY